MESGSSLLLGFSLLIGGVVLYFLPAIIAENRKHHNKGEITVLNLWDGLPLWFGLRLPQERVRAIIP